jgi:hypothetical protein
MYGLATGLVIANCVGAATTTTFVRRRLGTGSPAPGTGRHTAGALGRMLVCGLAGGTAAAGVAAALSPSVPHTWWGALLVLFLASVADLVIYAGALFLLGVDEARAAIASLRR